MELGSELVCRDVGETREDTVWETVREEGYGGNSMNENRVMKISQSGRWWICEDDLGHSCLGETPEIAVHNYVEFWDQDGVASTMFPPDSACFDGM